MSTYELISILEQENYTPLEIVELLKNIDKNDLDDYAVKNMICPICNGDLVTRSWWESRGECFGFPSREEMSQLVCQSCNWVES